MKKLFLCMICVVMISSVAHADPYELPSGTKAWGGASGWKSDINKIFNYFDATAGKPAAEPTIIGPLNVTGTGNSFYAMPNNATFTDNIASLYLWTFYEGHPYVAESVSSGELDATALAGAAKTLTVKDALFDCFRAVLSGFSAGSVSLHYIGFAANDIGVM